MIHLRIIQQEFLLYRNESRFASAKLGKVRDDSRRQEAKEQDQRVHAGGVLGKEEDKSDNRFRGSDSGGGEKEAGRRRPEADLQYSVIVELWSF